MGPQMLPHEAAQKVMTIAGPPTNDDLRAVQVGARVAGAVEADIPRIGPTPETVSRRRKELTQANARDPMAPVTTTNGQSAMSRATSTIASTPKPGASWRATEQVQILTAMDAEIRVTTRTVREAIVIRVVVVAVVDFRVKGQSDPTTVFGMTDLATRVVIVTKAAGRKMAGLKAIAATADEAMEAGRKADGSKATVRKATVRKATVRKAIVRKAIVTKAIVLKAVEDAVAAAQAAAGTRVALAEGEVVAPTVVKAVAAVRAGISADEVGGGIVTGIAVHRVEAVRSSHPAKWLKALSKVSLNCIPEVTDSFVNQRKTTSRRIQIHSSPVHWSRSTSCGKVC